jgi:hypothetical protein
MKTLKIVLVSVILSFLLAGTASAQAIVVKDHPWHLETGYGYYESFDAQGVYTPGGNINIRINFLLDLKDPLILIAREEGPFSFEFFVTTQKIIVPCTVTVFPNGRVKINAHLH